MKFLVLHYIVVYIFLSFVLILIIDEAFLAEIG